MRWAVSHRFDPRALPLADRHYNRRKIGSNQFVPPGSCLVLLTPNADALWVTSAPLAEYVRHEWAGAWVCTLFRREPESPYLASELIKDAVAASRWRYGNPPAQGFVTFVDRSKTRSKRDPGYCYQAAGWHPVDSDLMPSRGDWAALEQLGFVNRGPVADDPIFVHADLPPGWRKEGLGIVDERGLKRVEIAYKAAFYGRGASFYFADPIVAPVASSVLHSDDDLKLPQAWNAFTDDEKDAVRAHLNHLICGEAESKNPYLFDNDEHRERVLDRARKMLTLIN